MGTTADLRTVRVIAGLGAAFWAVLFFGLIDLSVLWTQDESFYDSYLLETGWGLLFTVLVAAPCVLWAAHPSAIIFPYQLLAVAAAVAIAGLAAPLAGPVVVAVLLALGVIVTAVVSHLSLKPTRRQDRRSVWRTRRLPTVLVAVAAAGGVVYALAMVSHYRAGETKNDITWGISHLPMQAALGLAVVAAAYVAVLAEVARLPYSRTASFPPAIAAVWLGAVSLAYPHHLGSLGRVGGALAVAWGLAFVAAMLASRLARGSAGVTRRGQS